MVDELSSGPDASGIAAGDIDVALAPCSSSAAGAGVAAPGTVALDGTVGLSASDASAPHEDEIEIIVGTATRATKRHLIAI